MFLGPTSFVGQCLDLGDDLTLLTNVTSPELSTPDGVRQVLDCFLSMSHLEQAFVQETCKQLAGLWVFVTWFIENVALLASDITEPQLVTQQHWTDALEATYRTFSKTSAASLGMMDYGRVRLVNEALAAFVFTAQLGGRKLGGGRLQFPEDCFQRSCGVLELVQDNHTTTISIPFPFLLRFFVERAEDADWADRTQLFHLFNACASQPATFVGVLVQQMFGTELLDQSSPLYPQIRAVFEPHVDLHPILLIPPVKVFTRPSDIDGLVEISRAVYAVQDVLGGTEGRSTDVACPMLDQRTTMIRALKFEIKYGTPLVKDASTQNLELRKKGCEFFVKAAEEN